MDISNNPMMTSYQGIQNGFNQLDKDSKVLSSPNQLDKTEALVNQDETQVQASAKAVKAADDMIGTLIDTFA